MSKLSKLQQEFLKELFGHSAGNIKAASKKVLGSEDYSSILTDELLSAIKTRADNELALNIPRAIFVISKMMEDNKEGSEQFFFSDKLLKVATEILDRAGLSKVERNTNTGTQLGIVFLPNKAELLPPPEQETETLENVPRLIQNGI